MKPILEKVPNYLDSTLAVKREIIPNMIYPWHYHPEGELIYVKESYGTRLMGDHIGYFNHGDMVLIGPNLPHVWKNDNDFYQGDESKVVDVYVIHFLIDEIAPVLMNLPEARDIKKMLKQSSQGLMITGKTNFLVSKKIESLYQTKGFGRVLIFLEILNLLSQSGDLQPLSSKGYNRVSTYDQERIGIVYDYVMSNFREEIRVDHIANLVHLTKSSFCRYFKSRTTKTFTEFLNEVRIGKACRLLTHEEHPITKVSDMVGFKNISYFNRQFKKITGITPKQYYKTYKKKSTSKNGFLGI